MLLFVFWGNLLCVRHLSYSVHTLKKYILPKKGHFGSKELASIHSTNVWEMPIMLFHMLLMFQGLRTQGYSLSILKIIKLYLLSCLCMYSYFMSFPSQLCSSHLVIFHSYIKALLRKVLPLCNSLLWITSIQCIWAFAIAHVTLFHNDSFPELSPVLNCLESDLFTQHQE